MKTLTFDVMLDGRFVCTLRYEYCPLFPVAERAARLCGQQAAHVEEQGFQN